MEGSNAPSSLLPRPLIVKKQLRETGLLTRRARREGLGSDHSRQVVAGLIRELTYPACLGLRQVEQVSPSAARVIDVYIKILMGVNLLHSLDGVNNPLFSQGCVLENGSSCGQNLIPGSGKEEGTWDPQCPVLASISQVNQRSSPLYDLLQRTPMELSLETGRPLSLCERRARAPTQ